MLDSPETASLCSWLKVEFAAFTPTSLPQVLEKMLENLGKMLESLRKLLQLRTEQASSAGDALTPVVPVPVPDPWDPAPNSPVPTPDTPVPASPPLNLRWVTPTTTSPRQLPVASPSLGLPER